MIELLIAIAFMIVFMPLGYWALGKYLDWRYQHWLDYERHNH